MPDEYILKAMANPNPDISKLDPVKSKEEARKRGRNGGIKSGESKRQKALLSQVYGEILAEKNALGRGKNVKGVVKEVLKKGGSPAVSMLKEIREATEGSNIKVTVENYEEQAEKLRAIIESRTRQD